MYFKNNFSNLLFEKGHRTITLGAILLGGVLFFLGILIFAYPTLIAYLIGAIILFAGLSVLFASWKLWKFRNEITRLDKSDNDFLHYSTPKIRRSHITYVRW